MKKTLGILFITIAALLALSVFGQIPAIINVVRTAFGDLNNGEKVGELIGYLFAMGITVVITIFLFIMGLKWVKYPFKKTNPSQSPEFPSANTNRNSSI